MKKHPLYRTWATMIDRCYNKKDSNYHNYGGRGIVICKRWLSSFRNFINDMGEKPSASHSIDRINNDGNYKPSNCKWSTRAEQVRNRRCSKINAKIAEQIRTRFANGERNKDLAKEFGLHVTMVSYIVHKRYWK